jgi:Tfp pilus assembly protein PilF
MVIYGGSSMGTLSTKMFYITLAASLLAVFFVEGCSQTPRAPEGILDTPAHHVSSGFKFLKKNYDSDARREFELALQLDPYYSAAHRGLGLVYGKENEFQMALHAMGKAKDDASSGEQKALAYVGFMQIYTLRKNSGWLEQVEARYKDALRWKTDIPEAYFYMGMAYKNADRIADAEQSFNQVIKLNGNLVIEAKKELTALKNPK